ncbi:M23 family metallopeptidase [Streptacidiphilus carbonis]|uniref:M23 family metallopeptidase n=1 Tax=Streptacidiphilus carbonis TaxID=105422 RepID=UPI000693A5DD|nr:peptidoglycan DD-metalloendopeptidase family protein [Streptacidiphilus carbonis]
MSTRDRLLSPLLAQLRGTTAVDPVPQALVTAFTADRLDPELFSPELLRRVPLERLQATVDALRERHGEVRTVRRQRELYLVQFARGAEPVWAQSTPSGRLTSLVTGPGAVAARRVPAQTRVAATMGIQGLRVRLVDGLSRSSARPYGAATEPVAIAGGAGNCATSQAGAAPATPQPPPARTGATAVGGSPAAQATAKLVAAYFAAVLAAAVLPFVSATATGWLLLTAATPALAWYALRTGPTHALPPWFRALPVAAVGLAVLAGLRALPALGPGLPWGVPGLPELLVFAAVLALAGWTRYRSRPIHPSPSAHPLTLGSPLRGGCFAVVEGGGPAVNRYAQESLATGAGRHRRHAVDLVQLGDGPQWRGRRALGLAPAGNERYAIFGHPVLSPCAGVVVTAVDGLPDHAPQVLAMDHPEGNHIAIDTGRALVVLSRLRQDSIRVRRGQHVTAGAPVAAVGNSGDGAEPSLQLRAETRTSHPTPGSGAGLPFRFNELRGLPLRGRRFRLPD